MKKFIRLFISLCSAMILSGGNGLLYAQKITDTLDEVYIKRNRNPSFSEDVRINEFASGQKKIAIDSLALLQYKMQNAAQLLSQQTPVFIRSYGFNGLATLNFRGSSSAQSQVYWNGIPVSNAALGIADISLLPVTFMNKLQIVYGGSAALLGSGNVGGALLLETENARYDTATDIDYEIGLGAGSYHQYQLAGKINYAGRKWFLAANILLQTAKNDFDYNRDGVQRNNDHSELKGASAMLQAAYKFNDQNSIKLIGWYQQYDRNIPAALFEAASVKVRKDASFKVLTEWNHDAGKSKKYIRAAFITDKMNYDDKAVSLSTLNCSQQFYMEAGWKQTIASAHKLLLFIPVHISQMTTAASVASQSRYALAAAYSYNDCREKLNVSINTRVEKVNQNSFFLPGISASYQVWEWMKFRANIQRTYRVPTLNELFFEPGGNKNLKPEQGWAQDAGYTVTLHPIPSFTITHDLAAYHRLINNWIVWYGGAIWTPHNLAKVRSSGIELEYLFKYKVKKAVFHLGFKGNYTRAVTVESYLQNDGSIHKQIPYTPKFIGLVHGGCAYRSYYINCNYIYTGLRYFNTDETGLLPAYETFNMQMSKDFSFKEYTLQTSVLLNNILDQPYTVVASRPMPGRNVSVSVTLKKK